MSLVTFIGPRPNLLDLEGTSKQKRLEAAHPILTNENLERIRGIGEVADNQFRTVTLDITFGADHGAAGMARRSTGSASAPRRPCAPARTSSSCPTARPAPTACRSRRCSRPRRASSSDPRRPAHLGRPGGRDRRGARGASVLHARRLRRRGDQSLSRLRDASTTCCPRSTRSSRPRKPSSATSRRPTRASSKSCRRWASRPISPIAARRFSTRSASDPISSPNISPAPTARSRASVSTRSRARRVERHSLAFSDAPVLRDALDVGGEYAFRMRGEAHMWRPKRSPTCSMRCAAILPREVSRLRQADQRAGRAAADAARHVPHQDRRGDGPQADPARSRSSPPRRSSSASRPAPCRSARSAARRTRRSRSP